MHRSIKDTDHHASEKGIYYILKGCVCIFSCELSPYDSPAMARVGY